MVKWGSTVCTAIKWDSTFCTQVNWGSTKVFPDASGATVYGYGSNIFGADMGTSYSTTYHGTPASHQNAGFYVAVPSEFTPGSSSLTLTSAAYAGFNAPTNSTDTWFKSTTKIKIVCNLQLRNTKSTYGGSPGITVGVINAIGQFSVYVLDYTIGTYTPGTIGSDILLMTYTGGTYTFTSDWSTNANFVRWAVKIDSGGTYVRWTGTISEVTLLS